ncbi:MAG: PIN domain-containing protein [Myxacorys californica WJT36-NPBG1]|nr:PIN domain-containing protein [Myxacorys californica WJT36-NPBG1]
MKLLLDTNIILDFFLERDPFYVESSQLFDAIAESNVEGFFSASSATDIFYICRRQTQSLDTARQIFERTLALLTVCPVTQSVLETAFNSGLPDFEDAVQISCAVAQRLDAIVTRNPRDFQTTLIPVVSIANLLQQLNS